MNRLNQVRLQLSRSPISFRFHHSRLWISNSSYPKEIKTLGLGQGRWKMMSAWKNEGIFHLPPSSIILVSVPHYQWWIVSLQNYRMVRWGGWGNSYSVEGPSVLVDSDTNTEKRLLFSISLCFLFPFALGRLVSRGMSNKRWHSCLATKYCTCTVQCIDTNWKSVKVTFFLRLQYMATKPEWCYKLPAPTAVSFSLCDTGTLPDRISKETNLVSLKLLCGGRLKSLIERIRPNFCPNIKGGWERKFWILLDSAGSA